MKKAFTVYLPSVVFLVFIFVFGILFFAFPKAEMSQNEKRVLAKPPAFTTEALMSGSFTTDLQTYISDHFPARDLFVGVHSYAELLTGRGSASDVYFGKDGYLIGTADNFSADAVKENTICYAGFAEHLGLNATIMIVPSTGYTLSDKLPAVHKAYPDDAMFETVKANKGDMTFIDLREPFKAMTDVQLYYKTDHHLTAAGSFELYKAFLKSNGMTPKTQHRIETYDDFFGTYYSRSGYWLTKPDTVELWIDDTLDVTVEISDGKDKPAVYNSLYFKDHLQNMDKYPVYLNGNNGLVKITNPHADGGKLLIVKDSFAHCMTTYLARHYSEIYMIDLREYSMYADKTVSEIVTENGIKDVLFLYGVDSIATDATSSFNLFNGIEEYYPE